jgi:NAD+ diphosphatase
MDSLHVEMNFCRRCGTALHLQEARYVCDHGHILYSNSSPATALILLNAEGEALITTRAINPGKGMLDLPGGFCDKGESFEDAIAREIREELGLTKADYTSPTYLGSRVEGYKYGEEMLPVLVVHFVAALHADRKVTAADEIESYRWVSLLSPEIDKMYFAADRFFLKRLRAERSV